MVAKNKAITGQGQVKKLTLKRETLKDLDAKGNAKNVKGADGSAALRTTRVR